jgi:hypothetical protein
MTALGIPSAVTPWALGDGWVWGLDRKWGRGEDLAQAIGKDYGALRVYGTVVRAFPLLMRINKLSFFHHQVVMAADPEDRQGWLARALEGDDGKPWSANQLKAAIAQAKVSNRRIAKALGVNPSTIDSDIAGNPARRKKKTKENNAAQSQDAGNPARVVSGDEAAE